MSYEIIPAGTIAPEQVTRTDDDGTVWFIPKDENNSDYQAYLVWEQEQPTPEAS
jgi:hypothetical protein